MAILGHFYAQNCLNSEICLRKNNCFKMSVSRPLVFICIFEISHKMLAFLCASAKCVLLKGSFYFSRQPMIWCWLENQYFYGPKLCEQKNAKRIMWMIAFHLCKKKIIRNTTYLIICPKNIYFWPKNCKVFSGGLTSRIFIYIFCKRSWKFRHSVLRCRCI